MGLGRLRAGVLVFAAAFVAALALIQAFAYWARYESALEAAAARAENLAHILKEHVEQTVAAADTALRQLALQSRRLGGPGRSPAEWAALLDASASGLSGVSAVSVLDSAGIIRHSTVEAARGQDRSNQYLFRTLRDGLGAAVVADTPFRGLDTGAMLLPIGRRLHDDGGAFAGAVVASLQLSLLREIYRSADAGPRGIVRVMHPSGAIFVREPSRAGETAPAESARGDAVHEMYQRGALSGVWRGPLVPGGPDYITAFRSTGAPELIVAVSLARDDVVGAWREDLAFGAAITALSPSA